MWRNITDVPISWWTFWNVPRYCVSPDQGVKSGGEIAAENSHKWAFTLRRNQIFWGEKTKNTNKNPKGLLGTGWKKQLEQLNIAETLSGISCLLSTVYQSLYLHLGPGLTGESSRALNEMDKWKLGEQTAATAAQNFPFSVTVRALSAVARRWSRTSVPALGSARGPQKPRRRQRSWEGVSQQERLNLATTTTFL